MKDEVGFMGYMGMIAVMWYKEFGLNSVYDFLLVQHRVRLGKYKRDSDSLQREGENLQAVWSPDAKLIAILVSLLVF